ncbi:MAG: hypothetical protein AVDCRST_MAG70-1666 [uncultured Thermomicrobiales bacterium]|uniref:Uncharacterized protein n=1 Tax=uncultured Thermomicrobiales bacterium TaxID=1645740 RepID=A0A6J4UW99_9BACT|nr:MAG: hypothetical protein AVDCRST_MAG70-1666 [uncultured Thermomicrobiales bacterium]
MQDRGQEHGAASPPAPELGCAVSVPSEGEVTPVVVAVSRGAPVGMTSGRSPAKCRVIEVTIPTPSVSLFPPDPWSFPVKNPLSDSTPPTELAVVGERKDDPSELLLLGADGRYYAYLLPDGHTKKVDPDDRWHVDPTPGQQLFT